MYKNIIFDIGKVLLDFTPEKYLSNKFKGNDKVREICRQIFQSEQWIMLDRGTLTEEEAINIIVKSNIENEQLIRLAFQDWYEILKPIEGTINILKDLKKANYKVFFLSNFHLLAFEYVTKKYDFFNLFDGGIVSYKEKLIKPEDKIYMRLSEEYNIKPEESIFIDDVQANIDGAKRLNFETILFKNPEDLRKKLISYNIKIQIQGGTQKCI